MVKKETFVQLCNLVDDAVNKTERFEQSLQKLFDLDSEDNDIYDNRLMLAWPAEIPKKMLVDVITEMASYEEAVWFVDDAMDQITYMGGTKVDNFEIKSYGEYYDYLVAEYQKKEEANGSR